MPPSSPQTVEWASPWYTAPMQEQPDPPIQSGRSDSNGPRRASARPSTPGDGPLGVAPRVTTRPADAANSALLDAAAFESLRRYLFAVAYRMLGSASEAEDIVQDAYLRSRNLRLDEVQSLKAYLATVVTRLCLDHLRSARAQREVYVGPWLPEPVPTADLVTLPAEAAE